MPINTPLEAFTMLLSDIRRRTERSIKFFGELGNIAEDPDVKEALEARVFVSERSLEKIDQAFKLIGQKPVELSGRLEEIFVEDFRRVLAELQSPIVKRLFVLAKITQLTHLRIGEYVALVAAADITGNYGVGVLLESCLAESLAFVERTRRLIGREGLAKIAATVAK
jgi:ferritin-like metal-binding protein YciE